VMEERGLLTVTGGKLTTFRLVAHDALAALQSRLPQVSAPESEGPVFDQVADDLPSSLPAAARIRLLGRHGAAAAALVAAALPGELEAIPGTPTLWAELRWAAQAEGVVHLDDLLLRRVRLGLLVPQGGAALMPRIRTICQRALGWDDARWQREE